MSQLERMRTTGLVLFALCVGTLFTSEGRALTIDCATAGCIGGIYTLNVTETAPNLYLATYTIDTSVPFSVGATTLVDINIKVANDYLNPTVLSGPTGIVGAQNQRAVVRRITVCDARLAIEKGEAKFKYDARHGWLPDVLKHLQVSEESQVLVFSKTSLQLHKISPRTPRALYFNDDVYVGWCQHGDVVELAATDPELGAVFYTMDQDVDAPPRIVRDRGQCLTCHATTRTQGIPGYLIRSVYPDINGRPRTGSRTYVTDQSSPFEQRWGGWYVTGLRIWRASLTPTCCSTVFPMVPTPPPAMRCGWAFPC